MRSLKSLWTAISGEKFADDNFIEGESVSDFRRLLKQCPVCKRDFTQHRYTPFATVALDNERGNKTRMLLDLIERHLWQDLQNFQSWEGLQDNLEVYMLLCKTEQIAVIVIYSPHELDYSDEILACNLLNEEDSRKLQLIINSHAWKPV